MNVVELTKELIAIPSESRHSNRPVSDFLAGLLDEMGFDLEEVTYYEDGEEKVSLVAKKGRGDAGLGFFSHSDTVPGGEGWEPFQPVVNQRRLYGRGSCDTKGPLAASIVAASAITEALDHPVFLAITSDEECGLKGARRVVADSKIFGDSPPEYGVICEATGMVPVYAHKGVVNIRVTAHGVSAHSSTDKGISSNFKIAPFLAEMAELKQLFDSEQRFMNPAFDPPVNGINMVFNDGGTAHNVTASRTDCSICFRAMPDASVDEAIDMITSRASKRELEVELRLRLDPFCGEKNGALAQAACRATGAPAAVNVPYGTEAFIYQHHLEALVLGPGHIAQAHTKGEFIDIGELESAVEVYRTLIDHFCSSQG
jgi:acetylornithine deacetylase